VLAVAAQPVPERRVIECGRRVTGLCNRTGVSLVHGSVPARRSAALPSPRRVSPLLTGPKTNCDRPCRDRGLRRLFGLVATLVGYMLGCDETGDSLGSDRCGGGANAGGGESGTRSGVVSPADSVL
jgi:hypothetical protein